MELTGKDIRNIRLLVKMESKDFARKAGLKGSYAQGSVYRWEHDLLKPSAASLASIKRMFYSKKLSSVMQVLSDAIAEIDDIPGKIDLVFYPDEDTYQYFHGEKALPFSLYQETNKKIINVLKKLGVSVSLEEINKLIYTKWIENKGLEDNQQSRTLFITNKETGKNQS